ncbi:MAG: alpha-galactosidase [Actinomyces sp.]|nr:MAG: alpha-galactosidase [Actinomyces sp.]
MTTAVHLRAAGVSLVVAVGEGPPVIAHWGRDLGGDARVDELDAVLDPARPFATADEVAPASLVPEHARGWFGAPGLSGRRPDGTAWATRFGPAVVDTGQPDAGHPSAVTVHTDDEVSGLRLVTRLGLEPTTGVLEIVAELVNRGDRSYQLDGLLLTVPVPADATELVTFEGRWCRETHLRRRPWPVGVVGADNRRGRTSHDHPPTVIAGTAGFGEHHGEVWGLHLAWSGNHTVRAEHLADGRRVLQLGELLHPGELVLEPGASYRTPRLVGTWSDTGLTPASRRWHAHLRRRPGRRRTPRKVLLNTWEAVYFDHDADRLRALAERAARVGIERFVLDDGWFGSRRDDTSGLGDWWVSPDAHPDGLAPLIAHVRSLGMDFGIWVEPEMVNPDSELYRAHPDWVLADGTRPLVTQRNQLVVDLARPDARAHILDALDRLLTEHDIAYVKWDMNRDHIAAAGADGRAGTHRQTRAVYELLDELRRRHPSVEFESCASGGGRVDAGILERTDRVWTSDCNDALERQRIQWGTSILVPPELMGAHIGPPVSHTTGRTHPLAFRALSAFFGHLGVEWNLLELDETELDDLAAVIALHKRHRDLLHTGDVLRIETGDDATLAHGVVAADAGEALIAFVRLATSTALAPPPLRIPGLDPAATYHVTHLRLPGETWGPAVHHPRWLATGATLTGAQLAGHGIGLPVIHPERGVLFHLARTEP